MTGNSKNDIFVTRSVSQSEGNLIDYSLFLEGNLKRNNGNFKFPTFSRSKLNILKLAPNQRDQNRKCTPFFFFLIFLFSVSQQFLLLKNQIKTGLTAPGSWFIRFQLKEADVYQGILTSQKYFLIRSEHLANKILHYKSNQIKSIFVECHLAFPTKRGQFCCLGWFQMCGTTACQRQG